MSAQQQKSSGSSKANVALFSPGVGNTISGYQRALAEQEILLRQARARETALLRQHEQWMRSHDVVRGLFDLRDEVADRVARLSPRQHQIMGMVVAGHLSKVIAWELGISQRTVENHRAAIMRKTGAKSLPELGRMALAAALKRAGGGDAGRS